MIVQINLKKEV